MRHLILGSLILAAGGITQARAAASADLSQYSCAGLDAATAPEVQQFSQVINGKVTEGRAFFTSDGGTRRLKCITITRPEARTLSADEAKALLSPPAVAAAKSAVTAPAVAPAAPAAVNVRPEPLKAKPVTVGVVSATAPLAAASAAGVQPVAVKATAAAPLAANVAPALSASLSGSARTAVTDTTVAPFKGIGYLVTTFPNGDTVRCTGSIISEYAVLTAGSCIHNAARGGYAVAAAFYPGQYEATPGDGTAILPIGGRSDAVSFRTTQHWTEISGNSSFSIADQAYNFGAVLFKTPYQQGRRVPNGQYIDGTYFLGIWTGVYYPTTWVSGYPSGVNGKSNLSQYAGEGPETQDSFTKYDYTTHTREFALPATPGDVGAPVYANDTLFQTGHITGIVTYADDQGTVLGGPSFDSWNYPLVTGWMNWAPPVEPSPQEAVSNDLRVASIFSTSQPTSQSYLRFHNASGAAGHVTVDLKNPTTGDTAASWTSGDIAAGSELQVFIQDIEKAATSTEPKPPNYAMSVKSTFEGYFQHVLWQRADNSLTNLTSCASGATNDPKTLVAVHSSLLQQGYPSTVVVYNSGNTAADISLGIFDARNGQRLGTYHVGVVQPGAQAVNNVPAMEKAASPKITPSGDMYHYVISADTTFDGYLQHIVQNTGDGVLTDMSIVCRLSPPQS